MEPGCPQRRTKDFHKDYPIITSLSLPYPFLSTTKITTSSLMGETNLSLASGVHVAASQLVFSAKDHDLWIWLFSCTFSKEPTYSD